MARLLGLTMDPSYGAALEKLAQHGDPLRYSFTLPLAKRSCANYSYAGLKTAVRLAIEAEAPGPPSPANHQVRSPPGPPTIRRGPLPSQSRCESPLPSYPQGASLLPVDECKRIVFA